MFLTIEGGRLVARVGMLDESVTQIENREHLDSMLLQHDGAMCSSTVDFPEEYTDDPAVIAMCRELRGE